MSLSEAIDILKRDKAAMELAIALGNGNDKMQSFVTALDTVIKWVDEAYSVFIKF